MGFPVLAPALTASRADSLRPSGLPTLGDIPWGTHVCQFYQTTQDLIDVLVPYFSAGLAHDEYCLWVTSDPLGTADARAALAQALPRLAEYERRGQVEILPYDEEYTPGGVFDADRVLQVWVERLARARARGFEGLRVSGGTSQLGQASWDAFTAYEAAMNEVIAWYRMIALCTHCLDRCDGTAILDLVWNHQFALITRDGEWELLASEHYRQLRKALDESARLAQGLRRAEERHHTLLLASSDILWTAAPDGQIVEDIPSFRAFTGQTYDEVKGPGWVQALHPDDRDKTMAVWQAAVRERRRYETEYRLRRADGVYRDVEVRGVPVVDPGGAIREWTGACTDITDRRRAERALRESEAALRQLNAELEARVATRTAELTAANGELEAFSYSVSHDLRAPLRALQGFSRILLEDHASQLGAEAQRYLGLLRDNAAQMGTLIDDLLRFSRLGRQALSFEIVDVAGIVQQAWEELDAERAGRHVDLHLGPLPCCRADPALLRQVLVNLLSNAVKFTRRRDHAVIEVGTLDDPERPAEHVYFVRDNGVGFDMQYAGKLFGVFQRLHRQDEYEGTGVGLAIVQRVVHRHGGRVWAEAALDRGATFYFALPEHSHESST